MPTGGRVRREALGNADRAARLGAGPRGVPRGNWGGTPLLALRSQSRDELAVRPRTIPTKVSTAAVLRSATHASATVDEGPSMSGR